LAIHMIVNAKTGCYRVQKRDGATQMPSAPPRDLRLVAPASFTEAVRLMPP